MKYLELWLIRHGETDANKDKIVQGHSDVPLNALGLAQAERLAERISKLEFDKVYSSDLKRALVTAQTVYPDKEIIIDKRLREINLGDFEGYYFEKFTDEEAAVVKVWFAGPYHQKVPGGESNDDMRNRALDWLASLPKTGKVIAFAHGAIIASIIQTVTGRPTPIPGSIKIPWSMRLDNTSISKLIIKPKSTVLSVVNDSAHLEDWAN